MFTIKIEVTKKLINIYLQGGENPSYTLEADYIPPSINQIFHDIADHLPDFGWMPEEDNGNQD